jgi:hypothetical protein
MTRQLLAPLLLFLAGCDQEGEPMPPPVFSKTSNPQIGVTVTPDMFVTAEKPLLADVGSAYVVRLKMSPAALGETQAILDVCRRGGSAVVTVKGNSIPPFIITAVNADGEALVICPSRERAVAILQALQFPEKDWGGLKP